MIVEVENQYKLLEYLKKKKICLRCIIDGEKIDCKGNIIEEAKIHE